MMKNLSEHAPQSTRARQSLQGLSVGDAFGQCFFSPEMPAATRSRRLPPSPWRYTDDTEMALAIVRVLEECGAVDQDRLAQCFAERFQREPHRGYGSGARQLLNELARGEDWRIASPRLMQGMGSFGNGAAMRAGPIGAWWADDIERAIEDAQRSAVVTHAHAEGQAGAVAVALAAVWMTGLANGIDSANNMLNWVAQHLTGSQVREGVETAAGLPAETWAFDVAQQVGCGEQATAQDTVPFSLWMAATHRDDFCEAMWSTARVGGDSDTTCAIVGSLVVLNPRCSVIPQDWLTRREPLAW